MTTISIGETLDSLIPPKVLGASISIIAFDSQEKVLQQFGTGTLLKIADDSFLVTAAHVATIANELRKSLCIGINNDFIQLQGDWCLSSENTPYDIAALRLPVKIASKLVNVPHVRLNDVDFSTDLSKGVFCLLGYPNRLSIPSTPNRTTMNVTPFQFLTYAYEGETSTLGEYQKKYHLLLVAQEGGVDNDGKRMNFVDRNGVSLKFPKDLGGISGCSIWKIGEYDRPLSEWKRYRPKIVAVQTSVYSDTQVIKATRWIAVSTLLYKAYPDLRQALRLWHVEY
jgi:hypothetical protein